MSLRINVLAAVITSTAALILTLLLVGDPLLESRLTTRAREDLSEVAREALVRAQAAQDPEAVAESLGAIHGCHVTLAAPGGRVVGDTALDGDALHRIELGQDPEVRAARVAGTGFVVREDPDRAGEHAVFVALRTDGREAWLARVSRPVATIEQARSSTRELLLLGGVIAGLASALLAFVLSRTLVGPIERLTATADALATGDLSARTRTDRTDELGHLGRSLDRMADQLEDRVAAARAEEARLRTVLDAMVEGVFVTDRMGTIVLVNRAFERLAPRPSQGRTVLEAIRSKELADAVKRARHGEEVSVELELLLGGDERVIAAELAPLPEDRGVVAVLHDVTALKDADRIRRDFVANASHELRTPLTAIRGYAETLRTGAAVDEETRHRFLDTILRHATRLQRLVDDLLALSRAESSDQDFELGPVDVAPLVREAVASLDAQARARGITIRLEGLDGLPLASASLWALDHVIVNLLDNAVKYTGDGGRVVVHVEADEASITVEVRDNGPGLTPDQRERIFERFFRVDSGRARDQGGTGLGLSIVKHLVQRMRAAVEVDSVPGEGSTFRVTLLRATEEAVADRP